MKPKISIIMGVYNGEETIQRCINSILNQTFKDWEFIICNDCSTDNTLAILNSYAQSDPRFKIISNEKNLGLAGSLNKCIEAAQTNILARQDADDTSEPDRFEIQYNEFKKRNVSVLGTYANLTDNYINWGENTPPCSPTKDQWLKGSQVIHASTFMNKQDIESIGKYNINALRVEDTEMWYRLLAKGKKIQTIPQKLYNIEWSIRDYSRKKAKYRIIEFYYLLISFLRFKAPIFKYYLVLRPIILLFVPSKILFKVHKKRFAK